MTGTAAARAKREYTTALAATAAGAAALITAAGQTWATGTVEMAGPLAAAPVEVDGAAAAPGAAAMGWAGLAAVAALLATRGRARTVAGALLAVFGAGALVGVWSGTRASALNASAAEATTAQGDLGALHVAWGWPALAALGGAVLLAAGAAAALRGPGWPAMGSRYDRHGAPATTSQDGPADPADLWKSLDAGEDPTAEPAAGGGSAPDGGAPDNDDPDRDRARQAGAPAAQKEP
ncbi:Trp biosynthesis-associated membrane protein [Nocardiopsis baichengensis]|uniref:Trp biosynthesis-associated membrane protein n=1 Tax=Nocardiopsis baichengensis TaxID=280240 RepID=UPI00034BAD57|nr:Trp biosynthesis-associated membrane protein [Nocardiopsis baichengensis]